MEPASGRDGAPAWVLDVALAAMGVGFAAALTWGSLPIAIMLALSVHVLVSLYHGRFGRFRKITWVMFCGGWTVSFLAYVLVDMTTPWSATGRWIDAHLGSAIAGLLSSCRTPILVVLATAGLVNVLGAVLDVLALHVPRLRRSRGARIAAAGIFALVIICAVGRDFMHLMNGAETDAPASPRGKPDALPDASLQIARAVVPVLMVLAAFWPWRRAWRLHAAPTRLAFTGLWLGAVAGWLGYGALRTWAPSGGGVAVMAILLYEFTFLAVVPFVLARFVRPGEDRRTEVF